jgi:predicted permease
VEGRRQELAIRAALGARWSRIATELLFESVVLGLTGSLVGLGLAYGVLRAIVAAAPKGLPRINEVGIDGTVLLFTLVVALIASVLFGSIPIFKYAGGRLSTGLREGARGLSQSREQHRARSVLVVVQVALALVLLICSGLMARTFVALTRVQPGFTSPETLQTFSISIPKKEISENERVTPLVEEITRKLAAVPGVSQVAPASSIPMDGNNNFDPIFAADRTYRPGEIGSLRRFKFIAPGFLTTMGTPMVTGRDFTWTDIYNRTPVALVSDNAARELWQTPQNALGKRIRVGSTDDWREIVGVVSDVYDDGVNKEPSKSVYWPLVMNNFEGQKLEVVRDLSFALRTQRAGTESLMKDVRQAVWAVDPNLPVFAVRTSEYYFRTSMARTSFTLLMLGVAAAMALLLGTVGIYGVIAYSVSQRTREIGIRMALGAQRQELTGLFVKHGLVLSGIGVVCGLIVAALVMRFLSSLLFRVSHMDLATYAAVSVGLIATAFLASYLPSRRAATVDPVEALRGE